jgi:hypothetical protein
MKHDAIVDQGIPIHERVPIPDDMIPADSRVEIDAKIQAGYFTTGTVMSMEELANVKGRGWEDIDVSAALYFLMYAQTNDKCSTEQALPLRKRDTSDKLGNTYNVCSLRTAVESCDLMPRPVEDAHAV